MAKRRLPTGIQTFCEIPKCDCYYVDKTGCALRLFQGGKHYFLSRPRRFGKSLFVDALKELFDGSRSLFVGLDAHDRWDCSVSFPVVRLDFGGPNATKPAAVEEDVLAQLLNPESYAGVRARHASGPAAWRISSAPCIATAATESACWSTSMTNRS